MPRSDSHVRTMEESQTLRDELLIEELMAWRKFRESAERVWAWVASLGVIWLALWLAEKLWGLWTVLSAPGPR